jgi:acyl carrier protein
MVENQAQRSEQEMRAVIRNLVRELAPQPDGWSAENPRLVEDLGYHSLALLELAFTLEDEFGLEPIDQETAKTIVTALAIEEFVMQRVSPGPAMAPRSQ